MTSKRKETLTATEAADRLARKFRQGKLVCDEDIVPPFKCEGCGGDGFHLVLSNGAVAEITDDHKVDWLEYAEADDDEQDVIWRVECVMCGHEVEFGWSHPNRAGRIWPVESADFNAWRCWPEPRFRQDWERRGWLRPAGQIPA